MRYKARVRLPDDYGVASAAAPAMRRWRIGPWLLGAGWVGVTLGLFWMSSGASGLKSFRLSAPAAAPQAKAYSPPAATQPRHAAVTPRRRSTPSLPNPLGPDIPTEPPSAAALLPSVPSSLAAAELASPSPPGDAAEPGVEDLSPPQPSAGPSISEPKPAPSVAERPAPTPAQPPPNAGRGIQSCEAAVAAYNEDATSRAPADITRAQYGAVLNSGSYFAHCGVPASMTVSICAAVRHGRAVGVTVTTQPKSSRARRCVASAVWGLSFPAHPKLDVTRTVFKATP